VDIEKMRKWLEITNSYRKSDFWSSVLKQTSPDDFFREEKDYSVYDIYQNEQYNFIIFEIPGVSREDLSLHLISNTHLKISGNIKPIFPSEMELKRERVQGEFERVIELPEATLAHLLNISIHNGLLYISYPRQ
jgi:HSP20 family protein